MRDEKGRFIKGYSYNTAGQFKKGQEGFWNGKKRGPYSSEWKEKISKNLKTKKAISFRFKKNDPRITGANNPNWANGITKLYIKIRNLWQYDDWKAQCRLRDNYTCQACGKYLKTLNERCTVDHYIKSFAQIIYENKIESIEQALTCQELWDINNGKTLCWPCHQKTDNYRKRLNRKEIN